MAITLVTGSKHQITIEDDPFAKGGEGKIHKIITSPSAFRECCVKLYEPKYRTQERQNKIAFLIQNKPAHLKNDNYMVCFPKELVFINNQFAGFIMPLAFKDSIQLEALCTPDIYSRHKHHQKFDRKLPDAFKKRLQLCLNLAVPIHLVHSLNNYVFVDIKPQNILVSPEAKIAIIDIDSIQIANNKQVIHPAQVLTPEYCPPERWNIGKGMYIPVTSDRFAVAVIFYQILFGIHPYVATFKGSYTHVTTTAERVKNGLFVHGHNASYIAMLPAPHQAFQQINAKLQSLFMASFELGLYDPNKRPTIDQWGNAFYDVLNSNIPIKNPIIGSPASGSSIPPKFSSPKSTNKSSQKSASKPVPNMIYAGFLRRITAFFIDVNIIYFTVIAMFIFGTDYIDESIIKYINTHYLVLSIFGCILYFSIMETFLKQATPGKLALGVKVTDLDGDRKKFFDILLIRNNLVFMPFIFADNEWFKILFFSQCIINVAMILWTDKKQTIHDFFSGTIVLKK